MTITANQLERQDAKNWRKPMAGVSPFGNQNYHRNTRCVNPGQYDHATDRTYKIKFGDERPKQMYKPWDES